MKFNTIVTGVGGEGALLTSVIMARAANFEGYEIRGTQLHGLAQRGGSIPTHIRFGHVYSPITGRGEADLILALEPLEAARYSYFASRSRTNFIIDNFPVMPAYARSIGQKYPSMDNLMAMIRPFAKQVIVADASNQTAKKLGNPVFGNVMCLGIAISKGMLPLKKVSVLQSIKDSVPRGLKENIRAFRMGLEYKD